MEYGQHKFKGLSEGFVRPHLFTASMNASLASSADSPMLSSDAESMVDHGTFSGEFISLQLSQFPKGPFTKDVR